MSIIFVISFPPIHDVMMQGQGFIINTTRNSKVSPHTSSKMTNNKDMVYSIKTRPIVVAAVLRFITKFDKFLICW